MFLLNDLQSMVQDLYGINRLVHNCEVSVNIP